MEFIDQNIENYALAHTTKENELLSELNRNTWLKVLQPRMLSGHLQGRILSLISLLKQPKKILEIGTYTGYSALCLAEGLASGGQLITIDKNEELEDVAKTYIERSDYAQQIEIKIGDAMEIVPQLEHDFDLVFIDADKENYLNYYKALIDSLPSGAIIIADNVLWSGKVIKETAKGDIETENIKAFNDFVQEDERVNNILMPVRDGLMIINKL